jgi:hypothetical protein
MAALNNQLRTVIQGVPWGEVFPPRAQPPASQLSIDGRTAALHILREYVTNLTFYRFMGSGVPPQPFQIPAEHFYIEWPDSTEDMVLPCAAIVHSRADYDVIGLVSYVEENTRDVYAPGTVLQWQAEYVETINLEIWTSKQSERRAILAGLEVSFSPTEQMSGVRFMMPEYFNELVCFTMMRREIMDEPDAARNRRKAQLELEMRFNIVTLVNYNEFTPTMKVNTDVDQDTQVPVNLIANPNAVLGPDLQGLANFTNNQTQSTPSANFTPLNTSYTGGGGNDTENTGNNPGAVNNTP